MIEKKEDEQAKLAQYREEIAKLAHRAKRYMEYRDPQLAAKILAKLIALAKQDGLLKEE